MAAPDDIWTFLQTLIIQIFKILLNSKNQNNFRFLLETLVEVIRDSFFDHFFKKYLRITRNEVSS